MEDDSKQEKYEKYLESIKKASKKYYQANKTIINSKHNLYYHEKLANNEIYKEKKRQYAIDYYNKKKDSIKEN